MCQPLNKCCSESTIMRNERRKRVEWPNYRRSLVFGDRLELHRRQTQPLNGNGTLQPVRVCVHFTFIFRPTPLKLKTEKFFETIAKLRPKCFASSPTGKLASAAAKRLPINQTLRRSSFVTFDVGTQKKTRGCRVERDKKLIDRLGQP